MKANVLGTEYTITTGVKDTDDPKLQNGNADGYCDFTTKQIVISEMVEDDYTMADLETYEKKVIRHELVHAFLYESGLDSSTWARDEEIVDWIALQSHKLQKTFEKLDV